MGALVSRLVTASIAFLYPVYASYKAIRANDAAALETWLMYWVVIGIVVAVESTVEWLISWIPLYYQLKTIFLIWLSLPQVQGSTYIYLNYIHPFLENHESDIDAAAVKAKMRAKSAGLEYVRRLWTAVMSQFSNSFVQESDSTGHDTQPTQPPPQNSLASSLLNQYGPSAVAATSALFNQMQFRPSSSSQQQPSVQQSSSSSQPHQRRTVSSSSSQSHYGGFTEGEIQSSLASAPWASSSTAGSSQTTLGRNSPSPHPDVGYEHVSVNDAAGYTLTSSGDGKKPRISSGSWRGWIFGESYAAENSEEHIKKND